MCAELLWWRCHRRIIADVLVALGHEVRTFVTLALSSSMSWRRQPASSMAC
jgi:uncharacterized protein (DUF488 family)